MVKGNNVISIFINIILRYVMGSKCEIGFVLRDNA